ncbi:hypothetical protein [Deinococcus sp. PEB2-63]
MDRFDSFCAQDADSGVQGTSDFLLERIGGSRKGTFERSMLGIGGELLGNQRLNPGGNHRVLPKFENGRPEEPVIVSCSDSCFSNEGAQRNQRAAELDQEGGVLDSENQFHQ